MIPALALAGWIRTYEINELSIGRSVRQTNDGGYVIAGQSGDENQCDLLLIKTDSLGDTLWTRLYGGSGSDVASCIQITADGGYIITGHYGGDLWLLKTNSAGDTVWSRIYGGSYYSTGCWVEQTKDGGYIVTGNYISAYLWLLKTDEEGYIEWQDTLNEGPNEIGRCIQQTTDGGYIVTGSWGAYLLLLKTNADGDTVWMRTDCPEDRGYCVRQTSDGGYIVVGYRGSVWSDIRLLKFNADGDTLWTRTYGGGEDDEAYEVQQTTDGGYIIVGETRSFGAGNYDAWLLKTDSLGDTLWTQTYGEDHADEAYSCQQTSDNGYIITGVTGSFGVFFGGVLLIKTDSLGFVGVEEPPVQVKSNWKVISPIGPQIILRYANRPQGFAASIFDATGKKVDELHSSEQSGTITWGECYGCYGTGVYFIREVSGTTSTTRKVILIH